jgi:hypothetical protein
MNFIFHTLGKIIPTDHFFFRGVGIAPTRYGHRTNIAIENGPVEIVDFSQLLNYQRVNCWERWDSYGIHMGKDLKSMGFICYFDAFSLLDVGYCC